MRVLIGGATGFIGKRLTRRLKEKGYEVIAVSRKPGENKITWSELDRKGISSDFKAIVNLAGENILNPFRRWSEELHQDLRNSRIKTNESLVQAIEKAEIKPKVFVAASAIGIYPPSDKEVYTEDSQTGGDFDFCTKLCEDWEASGSIPPELDVRKVTVRIGIALGREGGIIGNTFLPFFLGLGGKTGSGKQWFPWVHVDDVVGIIEHAIEDDQVTGVLNATAPEAVNNETFAKTFACAMWRPAFFPMPDFVVNGIFGKERAQIMLKGQKVVPERTLDLGYKFIYPDLKSACKEVSVLFHQSSNSDK